MLDTFLFMKIRLSILFSLSHNTKYTARSSDMLQIQRHDVNQIKFIYLLNIRYQIKHYNSKYKFKNENLRLDMFHLYKKIKVHWRRLSWKRTLVSYQQINETSTRYLQNFVFTCFEIFSFPHFIVYFHVLKVSSNEFFYIWWANKNNFNNIFMFYMIWLVIRIKLPFLWECISNCLTSFIIQMEKNSTV